MFLPISSALLYVLQEVEAKKDTDSSATFYIIMGVVMAVSVGVIICVVHVCCLRKGDCKCDTRHEDQRTTVSNVQQHIQVHSQHPPFNPDFQQAAYPQKALVLCLYKCSYHNQEQCLLWNNM
ncbi:hypothetical protein ACROYT_G020051 [Oculina patagonica]